MFFVVVLNAWDPCNLLLGDDLDNNYGDNNSKQQAITIAYRLFLIDPVDLLINVAL